MCDPTPAQEEFRDFLVKNSDSFDDKVHPDDRDEAALDQNRRRSDDLDEEDQFCARQIDAAMRTLSVNDSLRDMAGHGLKLPPASFDTGRATGVKGVIADARAYENARRSRWKDKARAVRRSVFGLDSFNNNKPDPNSDDSADDGDEEKFLQQWRDSRKRELEVEAEARKAVHNRRTSPSARIFGRLDDVDANGYLNAVENVPSETVVVVFIYDQRSQVCEVIESAIAPLVINHPNVHFVKVDYNEIEFDNAAVPAVIAYHNQGDVLANLTSIIDLIPEDEDCDDDALSRLFQKHGII